MILLPASRGDFDFEGAIRLDRENEGFSAEEMEKLAGPRPSGEIGARGSWWNNIWKRNRDVPPAVEELKSEFGYQSNPILTDLVSVAEAQGTPLDGIIKARSPAYHFYIMRCGVYIAPAGGERFEALKFEVRYADDRVSTYTMLPGPQTKKVLELGGKADIGVNGKAEFDFPDVPLGAMDVGASARADLEAKFILSFSYELKTPVVDSFGIGNPFCRWLMHQGDQLRNDVVFYPIIMTPKSVTGFECEFKAYFKIDHPNWKNAEFFLKSPRTIAISN